MLRQVGVKRGLLTLAVVLAASCGGDSDSGDGGGGDQDAGGVTLADGVYTVHAGQLSNTCTQVDETFDTSWTFSHSGSVYTMNNPRTGLTMSGGVEGLQLVYRFSEPTTSSGCTGTDTYRMVITPGNGTFTGVFEVTVNATCGTEDGSCRLEWSLSGTKQ